MNRPHAVAAMLISVAVLLAAPGCAPHQPAKIANTVASTASAAVLSDDNSFALSNDVAGLTATSEEHAEAPKYVAQYPQLASAPRFNSAIAERAKAIRDNYAKDYAESDSAELNLEWFLTQTGPYLGVMLTNRIFSSDMATTTYSAVVLQRGVNRVLAPKDLLQPGKRRELADTIIGAVRKTYRDVSADIPDLDVEGLLAAPFRDDKGDLSFLIGEYVLDHKTAAGFHVHIPATEAIQFLTDAGQGWLKNDSTDANPSQTSSMAQSATPTPTPTPTTAPPASPVAPAPGSVDCAVAKCVALTFDDGPGEFTPVLLNHLKAAGVRATFFVIGRSAATNRAMIKRESDEGHVVGNHTWNHVQLSKVGPDIVRAELNQTSALIQEVTGKKPTLMRPPYGLFIKGVTPSEGMGVAMWNVDTQDWRNKDIKITTERAMAAKPGSIVLFHDVHKSTVDAIPGVIAQLRAQGFMFVTVPELFGGKTAPGMMYFGRNEVR